MIQTKSATISRVKHYLNQDQLTPNRYASIGKQAKQNSLAQRFKNNQNQLRNRFKTYVQTKKKVYPYTHLRLKQNFIKDQPQQLNSRKARRQKNEMINELNHTLSQGKYFQKRNQQYEKAYSLLQNRIRKVQSLRKQRKTQVIKLQHDLMSITEQIKQQKLRYKKTIEESRNHLTKSKMSFGLQKLEQANSVRSLKQTYKQKIYRQKLQMFMNNKQKHKLVKRQQKNASINVKKTIQSKRSQAEDLKLQRLFRQLAEKEEIKIISFGMKDKVRNKITQYKQRTIVLDEKISQLRRGLGEKISAPKFINRSFTEQKEISTKSGFQQPTKWRIKSGMPFAD